MYDYTLTVQNVFARLLYSNNLPINACAIVINRIHASECCVKCRMKKQQRLNKKKRSKRRVSGDSGAIVR